MRGYRHGTYAVDFGMPQNGDNWFWSLNGWSLAESELSVVDQEPIQTFTARPALFGAHIVTSPGLLGHLLPLNSFTIHDNTSFDDSILDLYEAVPYPLTKENTGCPPLRIPQGHPQPSMNESWIALVMRGECGFDEKVRQAQRFGARAAVVGGQSPGPSGIDELISMSAASDGRDISIPAVYVTHATYKKLISLILASNMSTSGLRTISVVLGPEETWAWWSIMTLVTLFIHRIRAARHAARQRAPGDVVRALPVRVWTGTGWVSEKDWIASHPPGSEPTPSASPTAEEAPVVPEPQPQDAEGVPKWFASQGECAICLSSFARGDRVRVLPCSHVFHVEEVDGWLLNRRKVCPICKADVTHPAPRTTQPRVFPVVVHPADAEGRTSANSGAGVLNDDPAGSGVGSSSGAAPGSAASEGSGWWWQRVWRRAQERVEGHRSAATERTPLLPA
ncbi:hypothetical protein FRC07_000185 [Ceratobasidium sp. 392]|nr:hypothetical protein FRC07_000185 [Ceratobasidium sp. 392]